MEAGRARSIISAASSTKSTYLDYRPNAEASKSLSRTPSFQAARDYAESLGAQSRNSPAPVRPAAPRDLDESLGAQPVAAPAPIRTAYPGQVPHAQAPPTSATFAQTPPSFVPSLAPAPSTSSRTSSRPSFMNYQSSAPEPKPQPAAIPHFPPPPTTPVAAAPRRTGVLLLVLAAEVHSQTVRYVETALTQRPYSSIAIIGRKDQELAVKQLKMDLYGLVGKLGRDMGVQTHTRANDTEEALNAVVAQALSGKHTVQGVLCSLAYDGGERTAGDILRLEREDLQRAWLGSVGLLHGVAKATLLPSTRGTADDPSFFLVIETAASSPIATVNKATCDTLLRQLRASKSSIDITIDFAENVLIPEPEAAVSTNGVSKLHTNGFAHEPQESMFSPGESPTKLWNMWNLQDENGG